MTRSFDVFFDLRLNKPLSKQSWGRWFETLSYPLWRHCNVYTSHGFTWMYFSIYTPILILVKLISDRENKPTEVSRHKILLFHTYYDYFGMFCFATLVKLMKIHRNVWLAGVYLIPESSLVLLILSKNHLGAILILTIILLHFCTCLERTAVASWANISGWDLNDKITKFPSIWI